METSRMQTSRSSSVRDELDKSREERRRIRDIIKDIKIPEGVSIYTMDHGQTIVFPILNIEGSRPTSDDDPVTAPTSIMVTYLIARENDKYFRYAIEFPFGAPEHVVKEIFDAAIPEFQMRLRIGQAREVNMDGGDLGRASTN